MIQSAGNSAVGESLGFENLARFGPQATKRGDAVRAAKLSGAAAELTPEQQQQVSQLKRIDTKVRAHEQAHISVGADLILGGPTYSYQTGPDNRRYAVSGEVSIDTSPARTPEETIPKAQHIRATALAPADPSPQDHSVAAQASQMEQQARQELAIQQQADAADGNSTEFYRGVARNSSESIQVGSRFDLFA
jgi:hypothetical protein